MKAKYLIILIFAFITLFMIEISSHEHDDIAVMQVNQNQYHKLGYSVYDLELLNDILTPKQIQEILPKKITRQTLFTYLKYQSFQFDEIYLYEKIRKIKNVSYLKAMNLTHHPYIMKDFYQHVRKAINLNNYLTLVNKNYYLPDDYVPPHLVYMGDLPLIVPDDKTRYYIRQVAYQGLKALLNQAEKEGIKVYLSSAYRSYEKQERIYHQYALMTENADQYSARPGHSEHQTGLAVDITCKNADYKLIKKFGSTNAGQFIEDNAYKYGFIIRYPKDKEMLTGYIYEPWHLRYVGINVASFIHEAHITLEEYLLSYTDMPK